VFSLDEQFEHIQQREFEIVPGYFQDNGWISACLQGLSEAAAKFGMQTFSNRYG
jgi:hypothetical protein